MTPPYRVYISSEEATYMKLSHLIGAAVAAPAAICVARALAAKPTAAVNAKIDLKNDDRAVGYGQKLSQMVRCETISSRDHMDLTKFEKFHRILAELFPHVHANCEKHDFDGSLLFKWAGRGEADPIILMSHQDVVEAGGKWEHEPFSGDIDEKGRVWGRGTVDTKASLFCIFTALEELMESGFVPAGDVYIASSCTEEFSGPGAPATVEYLKSQGVRPSLVLDEGGMILESPMAGVRGLYAMVGVVEKGYADVKFTARSRGGHASAPGKNTPLVRLGRFMADIEDHPPFVRQLSPTMEEMLRRLAPNMGFGLKAVLSNLWLFKPLLLKVLPEINAAAGAMTQTTLAFTTAKGSDGLNVLPQEAFVTGNMRLIQHQDGPASFEAVKKIAAKYGIETEVLYEDAPCPVVSHASKQFRLIEEVTAEIYPGVQVTPYVMTGGTDAKFYKEICPNCIRFAPLYIDEQQYGSVHALNENIYQGALPYGVDFYKQVIRNMSGIEA